MKTGCYHSQQDYNIFTDYYNNDKLIASYKYPKIDRQFSSELLNDDNLICNFKDKFVGFEDPLISIKRVLSNQKPMGTSPLIFLENYNNENLHIDTTKYRVFFQKIFKSAGIVFVANKKNFDELIDVDKLASDYYTYFVKTYENSDVGIQYAKFIKDMVLNYRKRSPENYLDYHMFEPEELTDFIITGLVFGYPIETTISIMSKYEMNSIKNKKIKQISYGVPRTIYNWKAI